MARKPRRTDREMFIDELSKLSNGGEKMVSNSTLKSRLKWADDKYKRNKQEYWEEGAIIRGKGRGGTLSVKTDKPKKKISLFLSYAHQDDDIASRILLHLEPLRRLGTLSTWTFRELAAGDEWDKKIKKEIEESDIILMLVSIDFINSKYISETEVTKALAQQKAGRSKVVPVIARNCLWKTSTLGDLQALPSGAKPIASWPDLDDACVDVVAGIRQIAEDMLSE